MSETPARVYVSTDASARVRAIANTGTGREPDRGDLKVSLDGTVFYTVFYRSRVSNPDGDFTGLVTQKAVDLDSVEISFANGELVLDGQTYVLDENVTAIGEIVDKPVMNIIQLVATYAGLYVVAQDLITMGIHNYLSGSPLQRIGGVQVKSTGIVTDHQYAVHRYLVVGDNIDTSQQTVTFDGRPAVRLDAKLYDVVFTDDLSSVTVTEKK
ncbi:MAG TPA: hypothetical protein VLF91_03445 [Candidatus Saccharimonadales bacterium]|nr:hypothetical protein [Candidatus Saccharimonadales bacterium]